MNRACFHKYTNLHEQNKHASCIRPLKINFVRTKKIIIIFTTFLIISSCATTNEATLLRKEARKDKKLTEQVAVRKAVESKRFIIKLDRLYFSFGGIAQLMPNTNYIVIDGDKAIISAAYLGRQFDIKPISGINMKGKSTNYVLSNNTSKGIYKIEMDVSNNTANSFNVYLTIGENGSCSVSLSSLRIEIVKYSGHIVPIKTRNPASDQKSSVI